ncbi:MAG: extracellular solute-binding protein [bacterium]
MKKIRIICIIIFSFLIFNCKIYAKEKLTIFYAGSLSFIFQNLCIEFNKIYPEIEILKEVSGSRMAARKISELDKKADLIAVSDYDVIEELLMPQYVDWYLIFAKNEMVIAYQKKSKFSNKINAQNWYQILLDPNVKFGRGNENMDPCGYRTLILWQLSNIYYKKNISVLLNNKCTFIRPTSEELLALLEKEDIDYAFEYFSVAKQHNFKYVKLPQEINLGSIENKKYYKKAKVKIAGKNIGEWSEKIGEPIVYALTIPLNASSPKISLNFIKFLLSKKGREIIEKNYQNFIFPALIIKNKICKNEFFIKELQKEGVKIKKNK